MNLFSSPVLGSFCVCSDSWICWRKFQKLKQWLISPIANVHTKEWLAMLVGSYLFVITDREDIGSYLGHPVFKVSSMKILPCDLSLRSSPAEQVKCGNELYIPYYLCLSNWSSESSFLPLWAEKDRERMFCSSKSCREDTWFIFLLWC